MALTGYNLPAAMADFVARVAQFDPAPDAPAVATIELQTGAQTVRFALGDHVAQALHEALCGYYDPMDAGPCDRCGKRRLDANLQCRDCGHVNGVFGQVLLEHAERLRQAESDLPGLPGGFPASAPAVPETGGPQGQV